MSRISANGSLGDGMLAASHALRAAQRKFDYASSEVSRSATNASKQGVSSREVAAIAPAASSSLGGPSEASSRAANSVGKPPNPGPPGGSIPADLTELMLSQDQAGREISANAKTLQAFDEMLEEVTRKQVGQSTAP